MNKCLGLIFSVLMAINGFSQSYYFKNYGLKEGLSHNELHDIIQARDQSLWITSFYGVMNFDGRSFQSYTKDDGLCSNQIRNVFEDSKGRIWVGSWRKNGLSIIDGGKVFTPKDSILKVKEVMTAAFEDSTGTIWLFGTESIIKYKNDRFEKIDTDYSRGKFYRPNGVEQIDDNHLLIPLIEGGIAKLTLYPFSVEFINSESHGINNTCYSIFKDHENTIWVGHYGGLFSIKNDVIKKYELPGDGNKNRVWSIDEDRNGNLWMALYGGGFVRWDKASDFTFVSSKNGLIDNYCYELLIDQENNKWVTTDQGGLVKFRDFSFKYFNVEHGLPTNYISDVVEMNNQIICGGEKGLIYFANDSIVEQKHTNLSINDLDVDEENNLWMATKTGYGIASNPDLKIYHDDESFITINTEDHIFAGGYRKIVIDHEVILSNKHFNVKTAETHDNMYLLGLAQYAVNLKNGKLSKGIIPASEFNLVYASIKLSDSTFILGNPNEMAYLKYVNGDYEVQRFPRKRFGNIKGFTAFMVENNNLWIASDNALSQVKLDLLLEKDSIVISTIDQSKGFINGKSSPNALIMDKSKAIWMATSNGLMKYDPSYSEVNQTLPTLKIANVKLFSEPFNDSLYRSNGRLELPYDKNHFIFEMSAISLTHPENIKFKYRLKGLEEEWSDPVYDHRVVYSYLPPNDYQFEFIATNGSGYWEKIPVVYSFSILPPFWETTWFYFLIVLVIAGVFIYIMFRFRQRLKKKQYEQELFTRHILQGQEVERKRISKELHDGIGQKLVLISNAVIQEKNDDLPSLVNNTIDEVRSISRNLHPFQLERFGITKALEGLIEEISASGADIFFSEEIENIDGLLSKDNEINLYRIFQECINNIFKHSKAKSARFVVEKRDQNIYVEIKDNGVGFIFEKGSTTINSLGLKSLEERVKIMNGSVKFKTGMNKGTEINIFIKT